MSKKFLHELLESVEEGNFDILNLGEIKDTLVGEAIELTLSGKELKYNGPTEPIKGKAISVKLNRFEKACYVLSQEYKKKNVLLEVSLATMKEDSEGVDDEMSIEAFAECSNTLEGIMFDSFFRRFHPTQYKSYIIGYGFRIYETDIEDVVMDLYGRTYAEITRIEINVDSLPFPLLWGIAIVGNA